MFEEATKHELKEKKYDGKGFSYTWDDVAQFLDKSLYDLVLLKFIINS